MFINNHIINIINIVDIVNMSYASQEDYNMFP